MILNFSIKYIYIAALSLFLGLIVANSGFIKQVSAYSNVCGDKSITAGTNVTQSAFCIDTPQGKNGTNNPVIAIINDVTNIISAIAGVVAIVMIVISGFQMVSSSGNSEKIANARNTIIYSAIGLIIIALARIIVWFILSKVS